MEDKKRGIDLLDYLASSDQDIRNVGNTPTFRDASREEALDITMCSTSIINNIQNSRVSNEPCLWDHDQISFEFGISIQ